MARVTLRIDFGVSGSLGHGKVRLLERVRETGSIAAAGRAMDMSYRRAWLLIDEMNRMFRHPVTATSIGGRAGGGAALTPFGEALIARYRAMEERAHQALASELAALEAEAATVDEDEARPPGG